MSRLREDTKENGFSAELAAFEDFELEDLEDFEDSEGASADRPNLKELPGAPCFLAEWRLRRVGLDYHVEVEAPFYDVPLRAFGPAQFDRLLRNFSTPSGA